MSKFTVLDYQKHYTYKKFSKLEYKDLFFFSPFQPVTSFFGRTVVYAYAGKFWFKITPGYFKHGFQLRSFLITKQVAIYKKKQYLKKGKKK